MGDFATSFALDFAVDSGGFNRRFWWIQQKIQVPDSAKFPEDSAVNSIKRYQSPN
jgi:hypothetical protein